LALFTRKLRDELHSTCDSIREELDDHREAINEQSRDVLEVRDVLSEFDEKIEKLSGRIDELYLLLGADTAVTAREQALVVFLQTPRSFDDVAAWLAVSPAGVDRVLHVLTLKGVAVHQYAHEGIVVVTTNSALKGMHSLQSYL
jgi:predicted ArsR family transcriptional regulator